MSPGWRTYPKAKNHLVNTGGARWGPPTFRLPVAQTRLPQARAAGGWRRGSVGEHRGLGRGQWDEIIYRVVLFTKLLQRARLSGGWRELESRFGPSGRCRGGSLVNASRLRGRVAARPLPQAAQCFALVGQGEECGEAWLSHWSLRRGESASPDSSLMQTCSLVCFWVSPVPPDWTQTPSDARRRNRRKTGGGQDFRRSQCVNRERPDDVLSILRKGKSGHPDFGDANFALNGRRP